MMKHGDMVRSGGASSLKGLPLGHAISALELLSRANKYVCTVNMKISSVVRRITTAIFIALYCMDMYGYQVFRSPRYQKGPVGFVQNHLAR